MRGSDMGSQGEVLEVGAADFELRVLEESRRRPVVVDFWAPWCAPCRALGPVLERLAAAAQGRWLLAKLNTDDHQDLAARYRIQGIPAVKAFRDGRVVSEFTGALPEREVRRWLEAIVPSAADEAVAEGRRRLAEGDRAAARAAFERAAAADAGHPAALAALARLDADEGRPDDALARLERIPADRANGLSAELAALRLHVAAARTGGAAAAQARLGASADPAARIDLARALAAERRFEEALQGLLEIVRRHPRPGPGEDARKAMLEVFEAAGARSELSDRYRSLLAQELYK